MKAVFLLICLLTGCEPHDVLGTGWDFGGITSKVYECDVENLTDPAGTMFETYQFELCWPGGDTSLEASLVLHFKAYAATCTPTSRHLGPCIYGCAPHSGCNAFQSCWCPPDDR